MKKVYKYLLIGLIMLFSNISLLKAASASISVSSSTSKIVVGNSFTVTIKVSSSNTLGTWEFTPSYDTSKFKLTSGQTSVVDYGDGKTKSKSYTYKFKAIGTGSGTISVKSYGVIDYNSESKMSVSVSSKTINVITQSQLEASYSKNNNLKSLSIEGLTLSPAFNANTTKYTVSANANTTVVNVKASVQDSKSKVSGTGKHNVYEGENKINVTVTAQNGSTKTYTIIVNVVDPNPIEVTLNNQKYTVVKRESNLDTLEGFDKTTVDINNQKIPALFNELNNLTLIGLKNTEGDISLYTYNKENNTYNLYNDTILEQMKLIFLDIDKEINNLKKEVIKIDDIDIISLKYNDQYIVKARNFKTGEDGYYIYDKETNTAIRYIENVEKKDNTDEKYKKQILGYKKMIVLLGVETVIIICILICILFTKMRKNKKRRKLLQAKIEEERIKEEELKKQEVLVKKKEKKKTTNKNNKRKKKEVLKNEESKEEQKENI